MPRPEKMPETEKRIQEISKEFFEYCNNNDMMYFFIKKIAELELELEKLKK